MATFTLTAQDKYPNGTSVGAYPLSQWPNNEVNTSAAPPGSATNSQTMTNGTLTFTGLTEGTRYAAYALVGSQHRYTSFTAGADSSETSTTDSVVSVLSVPSGTDDLDTINSAITDVAVLGGGTVRGRPGSTPYKISGPIIVKPSVTLDMTGCTINFTSTAIRTNMLINSAAVPVASATDAATAAGSSVVASPTLAAVATQGQRVGVVGAGAPGGDAYSSNAPIWLYGTVASVAANNITLSGNTNGVAATATLSNATAYLFNTETDIEVVGGTWDAGTNWNTEADRYNAAYQSHLLRFRRVVGLTVRGVTVKQTGFPQGGGWCFGIAPGDCQDFLIEDCAADGSSTCVQGEGPLARGIVRNIRGTSKDDQVAFGTVGAGNADLEGDITDVVVDGVLSNGSWRALSFFAGKGANNVSRPMRGVVGRGLKGATVKDVARVVNYAGDATISAELIDVTATQGAGEPQVLVSTGQAGITVVGPRTGRVLQLATKTTNQTGLNNVTTDIAGLSITFTAPPSGAVWLEVWVYSLQQLTSASSPLLTIADASNNGVLTILCGSLAINSFSPSLLGRVKITGLTSGTSYTYKVRGRTAAGTADLQASATTPAYLRAIAA